MERAGSAGAAPQGAGGGNGAGAPGTGAHQPRPARRTVLKHHVEELGGVVTFGLVMAIGMGILGALLRWRGAVTAPLVLWGIGGATLVLALVAPGVARVVQRGWMKVAMVLGIINTTVLLTLFYVIFFGGLHLLWIVLRRDALKLTIDRSAATYWEKKTYRTDAKSYFSQF